MEALPTETSSYTSGVVTKEIWTSAQIKLQQERCFMRRGVIVFRVVL